LEIDSGTGVATGLDSLARVADASSIMPKRSSKRPPHADLNQLAKSIVDQTTDDTPPANTDDGKNPAAVALGRLGGKKGGRARADKLTAKKRTEIAKKAAAARWAKRRSQSGDD
jgi:hypothetical protein